MVLDESELRFNYEAWFGQITSCGIHHSSGVGNLALSHCGDIEKNGKFQICEDFQKLNIAIKEDPYPLLFMEEVQDMVARHELYSFLDGFLSYP